MPVMNAHLSQRLSILLLVGLAFVSACEPLVPTPTPQIIIVTATASPGPTITRTPTPTATPNATVTPTPSDTPTPVLCGDTAGQVIVFDEFDSAIAGRNMPYRVYVPPCYFETQRRYPVVYLLHGAANDDTHWQDVGIVETLDRGLALNLYPPMILVMPYGAQLLAEDLFPPGPSLETYLLQELIPRIEYDFCTWANREHRAIGGISRGGFWALSIAMRHPEIFSAVGGHSPALSENLDADFNPLDLALNAPFIQQTLRIYLDNGANDLVRPEVELLSTRLSQRSVPHEYVINPLGDHSDAYWRAHAADYLTFYGGPAQGGWSRDTGQLPSCLEPSP